MAIVSMKALLESGVHFGHRTNKWDPRMKPFIFTERNGIHIIDLQQTVKFLGQAYNLIRDKVAEGGNILFVGTKRQAQETIMDEAIRCGMPYVTERWLGGTLTNWSTIHQRVQELERLEGLRDGGEINRLTKKEGLLIERDIARLERRLSGIRDMKRLPDMLFVVDVSREDAAVHEANLLNIPIVAMVDTNCNPQDIDYVIPSNDDAIRAIKLLVAKIADAVLEGVGLRKEEEAAEEAARPETETPAAKSAQMEIDDQDIQEEDLLGEATLAKLQESRQPAEEEEKKPEEVQKEDEEQKKAEKDKTEAPAVGADKTKEVEDKAKEEKKAKKEAEKEAAVEEDKAKEEKKTKKEVTKKPVVEEDKEKEAEKKDEEKKKAKKVVKKEPVVKEDEAKEIEKKKEAKKPKSTSKAKKKDAKEDSTTEKKASKNATTKSEDKAE